jgi:hypothetical protein
MGREVQHETVQEPLELRIGDSLVPFGYTLEMTREADETRGPFWRFQPGQSLPSWPGFPCNFLHSGMDSQYPILCIFECQHNTTLVGT